MRLPLCFLNILLHSVPEKTLLAKKKKTKHTQVLLARHSLHRADLARRLCPALQPAVRMRSCVLWEGNTAETWWEAGAHLESLQRSLQLAYSCCAIIQWVTGVQGSSVNSEQLRELLTKAEKQHNSLGKPLLYLDYITVTGHTVNIKNTPGYSIFAQLMRP